ncbi:hypothetical protein [Sinosporangium siamense]|uniref:PQQ-binding-like beta-propeller repeat protein n=1 Tax=Sinosporangium siamense TaxID=1367973 RepID=A0A919V700_9ACTN|nr:hypothetical protein [Sinosporangium siamense]GII92988.1 hypothetical protein Ssi02_32190 [Sinosporangium siamense]
MRTRLLTLAAAVLLIPVAAPAQAETLAPPSGCGFQNLGQLPLVGTTIAGTALDEDHPDGPRVYSVTSSASGPALLSIRDALTGSMIAEHPLQLGLGSWAVTVAPDHSVYVGTYNGISGQAGGRLFRYTPSTDKVTEGGIAIPGESFVWTVAASPDGKAVYGGTSPGGKLFRYDTATGQITDLGSPVPGEQFVRDLAVARDGTVYAGVGAESMKVAVVDPQGAVKRIIEPPIQGKGYAYDVDVVGGNLLVRYSTSGGENPMGICTPKLLLNLTAQEQERPFAMVSAGDWLAFGTVPKSGTVGGALGLLDPATGRSVLKRNIVPGHSIVGLAYRDGVVYGATSAFGGILTPQGDAAQVFAYDIATDKILWQTAPVPGDLTLGSITFDGAGKLWGLTPDALYEMDPATGQTLRITKHQTCRGRR